MISGDFCRAGRLDRRRPVPILGSFDWDGTRTWLGPRPFQGDTHMFGSIGMPELIIILVIALIIFGPRKLPELGQVARPEHQRVQARLGRPAEHPRAGDQARGAERAAGEGRDQTRFAPPPITSRPRVGDRRPSRAAPTRASSAAPTSPMALVPFPGATAPQPERRARARTRPTARRAAPLAGRRRRR